MRNVPFEFVMVPAIHYLRGGVFFELAGLKAATDAPMARVNDAVTTAPLQPPRRPDLRQREKVKGRVGGWVIIRRNNCLFRGFARGPFAPTRATLNKVFAPLISSPLLG